MSDEHDDHVFQGSNLYNDVFTSLVLVFTVLGSLSSITILFLIYKMKLKNGHILLIWTMSWFQLLYDASFFNAVIHVGSDPLFFVANVAQEIGGISGSLTSNFIALISYYVVKNTKSIDVYRYYPHILTVVLVPSVVDTIIYTISWYPKYDANLRDVSTMGVYYYMRLISIAINFIVSFQTALQISKISNKIGGGPRTVHETAIRTLSMRLIYYPIVQAVSRSGCAWYEMQYGFQDFDPSKVSESQFIAQCFVAILTPTASIGYMAIFLLMQPNAFECLKCTLRCQPYIPKLAPTTAALANRLNPVAVSHAPLIRASSYSNFHANNHANSSSTGSLNTADQHFAEDQSQADNVTPQSSFSYSYMNQKDDEELWQLIGNHDPYAGHIRTVGREDLLYNNLQQPGYDYTMSQSLLYGHD